MQKLDFDKWMKMVNFRLRYLPKTLSRFWDCAGKIFRDPRFSKYHSPPLTYEPRDPSRRRLLLLKWLGIFFLLPFDGMLWARLFPDSVEQISCQHRKITSFALDRCAIGSKYNLPQVVIQSEVKTNQDAWRLYLNWNSVRNLKFWKHLWALYNRWSVNIVPCCRQSSWPVSMLHLHIQNLPRDTER